MQKILAIILFIISFFTTGDMTKANVTLYKDLTAGDTTAVFVFENNTGKALNRDIKIETIEKEFLGQWVEVPFSQAILETAGKSSFETRVYPGEKATLHVDFITTVGGIPVQVPHHRQLQDRRLQQGCRRLGHGRLHRCKVSVKTLIKRGTTSQRSPFYYT